jgi:arylsulfatase
MKSRFQAPIGAAARKLLAGCALLALTGSAAYAQQITGTPGSPSATTTLDGRYVPNPPPPFGGVINLDATNSKPYWPPTVVPPKGAPNVLLIITDDVGFGAPSTFGGLVPTPALDRIAAAGLRYTQFHSTALGSASRAAFITGRKHPSVGFGVITVNLDGLSRLQQRHHQGQGDHRHDP